MIIPVEKEKMWWPDEEWAKRSRNFSNAALLISGCGCCGCPGTASVWKLNSFGNCLWGYDTDSTAGGVAVDSSGNVYVASEPGGSNGQKTVFKLNSAGELIWEFESAFGFLRVAVDASGNVYVVGSSGHPVKKISSSGILIWDYNTRDTVYDVTIDNSGNVYVTGARGGDSHGGLNTVYKINSSGSLVWEIVINGEGRGITTDNSFIYVATDKSTIDGKSVYKLNLSGGIIWSKKLSTGLDSTGIDLDSSGKIYVSSEPDAGGNAVWRLTSGGGDDLSYDFDSTARDVVEDGSGNTFFCGDRVGGNSTFRIDSAFALIWSKLNVARMRSIASDGSNVYVAGNRTTL